MEHTAGDAEFHEEISDVFVPSVALLLTFKLLKLDKWMSTNHFDLSSTKKSIKKVNKIV